MSMSVLVMALAVAIIVVTQVIWRLVTKNKDADDQRKVANLTASIFFWGIVLSLIIIVLFYSVKHNP